MGEGRRRVERPSAAWISRYFGRAVDVLLAPEHVGDAPCRRRRRRWPEEHRRAVGPQEHEVLDVGVVDGRPRRARGRRTAVAPSSGTRNRSARPVAGPEAGVAVGRPSCSGGPPAPGPGRRATADQKAWPDGRRGASAASRWRAPASDWCTGSPSQSRPSQRDRVEDVVDELGPVALGVGVLDAQQELAAGAGGRTAS